MDRDHKIAIIIFFLALLLSVAIFRGYWLAPRPLPIEGASGYREHPDHAPKTISPSSVKAFVPETEIEIDNPVNTGINLDWEESSKSGEHLRVRKEKEALQRQATEASAKARAEEDAKVVKEKKEEEVRRKKEAEDLRKAWERNPVPPPISPPSK